MAGAEKPYMMREVPDADEPSPTKRGHHTAGHRNTSISMDTRADWSEAYALVPSLQVGYVWYASAHTLEVLSGLLAIGFDADDHGGFAFFDGIQIQIFDVSVLSSPVLEHKTVIGTRGSGSEISSVVTIPTPTSRAIVV